MNLEDNLKLKEFRGVLEQSIVGSFKVFIVAHDNPDLDAIASAIGLYLLCKKYKKECYIVINDQAERIEAGVKKIIEKEKNNIPFINLKKYLELKGDNDLLLTTDVNKDNRISLGENLSDFKDIVVIDHHAENEHTIKTDKKFITVGVSSASEVVSKLLIDSKVGIDSNTATYLLAGIKLDTDDLSKNTECDTLGVAQKLLQKGASNEEVQSLFQQSYESDVRIGELIKQIEFNIFQYAIACDGGLQVYTREELAKAADKAMKYGVDASFMIGYIDEDRSKVGVSARSNGKINVCELMGEFGGGGNPMSAATVSTDMNTEDLAHNIKLKLSNKYFS